jgi:hypothetical protein
MQCTKCSVGGELARIKRRGFKEKHLFSLFGYYPWRCASCKQRTLLRKRSERRGMRPPAVFDSGLHPPLNKNSLHRIQ